MWAADRPRYRHAGNAGNAVAMRFERGASCRGRRVDPLAGEEIGGVAARLRCEGEPERDLPDCPRGSTKAREKSQNGAGRNARFDETGMIGLRIVRLEDERRKAILAGNLPIERVARDEDVAASRSHRGPWPHRRSPAAPGRCRPRNRRMIDRAERVRTLRRHSEAERLIAGARRSRSGTGRTQ